MMFIIEKTIFGQIYLTKYDMSQTYFSMLTNLCIYCQAVCYIGNGLGAFRTKAIKECNASAACNKILSPPTLSKSGLSTTFRFPPIKILSLENSNNKL